MNTQTRDILVIKQNIRLNLNRHLKYNLFSYYREKRK